LAKLSIQYSGSSRGFGERWEQDQYFKGPRHKIGIASREQGNYISFLKKKKKFKENGILYKGNKGEKAEFLRIKVSATCLAGSKDLHNQTP